MICLEPEVTLKSRYWILVNNVADSALENLLGYGYENKWKKRLRVTIIKKRREREKEDEKEQKQK